MSFKNRLFTALFALALATCWMSGSAQAQESVANQVGAPSSDAAARTAIAAAEQRYKRGEEAFRAGRTEEAQKWFKASIEAITNAPAEVRSHPEVQAYYFELKTKVGLLDAGIAKPGSEREAVAENGEDAAPLDELSKVDASQLSAKSATQIDLSRFNFKFTVTAPVYQFINFYTSGRGRATMERGLARSGRYRAMAERVFAEEGVPLDLIWLAQVESVWQTQALSSARARGIWQFIPGTGARFGLRQDGFIDERSSPEASTRAAAKYLKFLHKYFAGDWLLAMAAYNCGEMNVERAIARCGYADFWELHQRGLLPNETKNYVPAILAVLAVAKDQKKYGFNVIPEPPMTYDTFELPGAVDLGVAAGLLNVPRETLWSLNPELKRPVTPPNGYALKIPAGTRAQFAVAFNTLPAEERMASRSLFAAAESPARRAVVSSRGSRYELRKAKRSGKTHYSALRRRR
jgi:membrane-bound lytic murein transglycosylase D